MNRKQLEQALACIPDYISISVVCCTPLYRQLQGDPILYAPYILHVQGHYAIAASDNHDEWATREEALQSGLRQAKDGPK